VDGRNLPNIANVSVTAASFYKLYRDVYKLYRDVYKLYRDVYKLYRDVYKLYRYVYKLYRYCSKRILPGGRYAGRGYITTADRVDRLNKHR